MPTMIHDLFTQLVTQEIQSRLQAVADVGNAWIIQQISMLSLQSTYRSHFSVEGKRSGQNFISITASDPFPAHFEDTSTKATIAEECRWPEHYTLIDPFLCSARISFDLPFQWMRDGGARQCQMGVGHIECYSHALIPVDDRLVEYFVQALSRSSYTCREACPMTLYISTSWCAFWGAATSLRRFREVEFNIWVGSVRESEFNDRRAVRILSSCGFEELKQSFLATWCLHSLHPMGSLVTQDTCQQVSFRGNLAPTGEWLPEKPSRLWS